MNDLQSEIGVKNTQEDDGQDQSQILGIVAVDIIIEIFHFPPGMPAPPPENVFAEGTGGKFPPVRLYPSFRLHRDLLNIE